jgi:hypothetical protein
MPRKDKRPFSLYINIIPKDPVTGKLGGRIPVVHIFFGETEQECEENFAAHAKGCDFLTPAIKEQRVDKELVRIEPEDWPEYDAAGELVDDDEDDEDEEAPAG